MTTEYMKYVLNVILFCFKKSFKLFNGVIVDLLSYRIQLVDRWDSIKNSPLHLNTNTMSKYK